MADRIERRSLGWLIRSVFEPIASGTAACWAAAGLVLPHQRRLHYLGPSLAVLLFAHVDVPGVALRIASAAVVFAIWRRPWRLLARMSASQRCVLFALGVVLAVMNSLFYLAVDRLPLSTVGAIEFLGTVRTRK